MLYHFYFLSLSNLHLSPFLFLFSIFPTISFYIHVLSWMIARCTYDRLFRQQEICVTIPNFLPFGYNNNAAFIESIRTVKKKYRTFISTGTCIVYKCDTYINLIIIMIYYLIKNFLNVPTYLCISTSMNSTKRGRK